jgi:hypothetical protein
MYILFDSHFVWKKAEWSMIGVLNSHFQYSDSQLCRMVPQAPQIPVERESISLC